MKVIKSFGPGDLRVTETGMPEPDPGQVRIKVRASGICGSDKWLWQSGKSDTVAGHEVAGEVDKLGANVTSLQLGDPVMINNVGGCGECLACRAGAFVECPQRDGSDVNNGFGEYVTAPARNCIRLLPGLDFIDGALIMDNWGTPYAAIQRAGVKPGTDLLVTGCGPIGQAAVALSRAYGAYVIAADPIAWRREKALENGANAVFAPEDLPDAVKGLTNGLGVHVVLECSGNGEAYKPALDSLRINGSMVCIGEGAEFMLKPSEHTIHRGLNILSSWYSTLPQAAELMQLALQKRIKPQTFVSHKISIEQLPGIYESIVNCDEDMLKCVIVFE